MEENQKRYLPKTKSILNNEELYIEEKEGVGKDEKPLSIETLTTPTGKIVFIASGNERLRSELFSKYKIASRSEISLEEK